MQQQVISFVMSYVDKFVEYESKLLQGGLALLALFDNSLTSAFAAFILLDGPQILIDKLGGNIPGLCDFNSAM